MQFILDLDHYIFQAVNSLAGKFIWLDWLGVFLAQYLIWVMAVVAFIWWFEIARTRPSKNWPLLGRKKWLEIGEMFLSIIWSVILNQLIGLFHFRVRPFVEHDVIQLINAPYGVKSFPSDHTCVAFALALTVWFYNKKLGTFLLAFASLVGLSRIFVGVHYPLDVIGGIFVGIFSASLIRLLFIKKIKN